MPISDKSLKIIETRKRNPCATLKQIGDKYHVSRERVRQILIRAGENTAGVRSSIPCVYCGKPLPPGHIKYCSLECRVKATNITIECPVCGKLFTRTKSSLLYRLNHKQRVNGKTVQHIFCSEKCRGVYAGNNYGFKAHPNNIRGRK